MTTIDHAAISALQAEKIRQRQKQLASTGGAPKGNTNNRKKAGARYSDNPTLSYRCSPEIKLKVSEAAEAADVSMSDWLGAAVLIALSEGGA